jgi:hypothetical protein
MHKTHKTLAMVLLLMLCFSAVAIGQQSQPAPPNNQTVQTQPSSAAQSQGANETLSPESQDRLIKEVRHELIMLPYYGVFDNLAFRIDGRTVTLEGQVTQPVIKSDAENSVKHIEGVEKGSITLRCYRPAPWTTVFDGPFTEASTVMARSLGMEAWRFRPSTSS